MKIICPQHSGLIDVPDLDFINSLKSNTDGLLYGCPVCGYEVLITNIQREIIVATKYSEKGIINGMEVRMPASNGKGS